MVTVELLCEKLNITDKRTVNQILANKELSEEIAKRDVISLVCDGGSANVLCEVLGSTPSTANFWMNKY